MIFADKLIALRKKSGWTQEELAEQMNVSRQSVSKWESAQSIPDLEKILRLSHLFGVSTDYLLKDDLETPDPLTAVEEPSHLHQISMEEANSILEIKEAAARPVALGVALCILSPVLLILLGGFSEAGFISEQLAGGVGVAAILIMISIAVGLFISAGTKTEPYDYLEKEPFETAYGVDGMIRERQRKFRPIYIRGITIGVGLCILSPVPILITDFITEAELLINCAVCLLLGMIALGVASIILAITPWDTAQILLQEGDYTAERKRRAPVINAVSAVYWLVVTAVFLACGFVTGNWGSWALIWPVAGVLFGAVMSVCNLILK